MQISHFINRHGDQKPECAVCSAVMWLARVQRHTLDYDKCTFHCPACENIVVEIVKCR
jgi:hypothetical protein